MAFLKRTLFSLALSLASLGAGGGVGVAAEARTASITYQGPEPLAAFVRVRTESLLARFPAKFRNALATGPVRIVVLPRKSAGADGNRISIPQSFVEAAMSPVPVTIDAFFKEKKAIHFKTMNEVLDSAIVHELAHLFDERLPRLEANLGNQLHCLSPTQEGSSACTDLVPRLSHTRSFLTSFDWVTGLNGGGLVERGNFFEGRSPATYEFKDPQESLAVNLEYFFLSADYKCALPTRFHFFSKLFDGFDPFPGKTCSTELPYLLRKGLMTLPEIRYASEQDLYEVHYLWASPGPSRMSSYGHAMFRLVFCAPGTPKGPACRGQNSQSLTVNFAADVPSGMINAFDGLDGSYPLLTTMTSFIGTQLLYNNVEFRSLYSLPLNLTESEKKLFLRKVIEASWSFEGRYFFFSRNCTTEALKTLKAVWSDPRVQAADFLAPDSLFEFLRDTPGLRKADVTDALLADETSGLYFASNKRKYETVFRFLQSQDAPGELLSPLTGIESLKKLSASDWQRITDSIVVLPNGPLKRKLLAATRTLIDWTLETRQRELMFRLREDFTKASQQKTGPSDASADEAAKALQLFLSVAFENRNPAHLLASDESYGIPDEREAGAINESNTVSQKLLGLYNKAREQLEAFGKARQAKEHQEQEEIQKLLTTIKDAFKVLNSAATDGDAPSSR